MSRRASLGRQHLRKEGSSSGKNVPGQKGGQCRGPAVPGGIGSTRERRVTADDSGGHRGRWCRGLGWHDEDSALTE